MDNRNTILKRSYLVYGFMLLLGLAILAKILYIQYVQGDYWRDKAKKLSLKYFSIEPNRGNIYDVNGQLLATSVPLFEVRMDVASPHISDSLFNANVDSLAISLAGYFKDKNAAEYRSALKAARKQHNRYFLIKRKATYDQLNAVRGFPLLRMGRNSGGLIAISQNKRVYPFNHLAYRSIGWYKEENTNNVGIEGAFNREMEGMKGQRLYQRIPDGNWRPLSRENEIEPENGSDIITTIDINIQDVAEEALLKQLIFNKAHHGCAIVMEVKTGEIRAIANLGLTKDGNYEELYNYAVGECTEPGSTFKLFSLLAAFEDKKATLDEVINCTGGVTTYGNRTMRDSHLGNGVLTVQQIFEKSSNVGVSKIIYKSYATHPQDFIDRIHSFGVNQKIGLEIGGEARPQLAGTESKFWSNSSLPWKSIGYEVALTPLQILNFYNAVANNGMMVKPHLIKEIRKAGLTVKTFPVVITKKQIASERAIKMAKVMLEGVVENGTGKPLKNPIYKVAGKTGTAQLAQNSGGYNKSNYKGSFVGYFPADNPKYSCIVVINNPTTGGYYGGAIAAPVFREIADRLYATDPEVGLTWNDSVQVATANPVKAGDCKETALLANWLGYAWPQTAKTGYMTTCADSTGSKLQVIEPQEGKLPSVIGMGMRDATHLLEQMGMKVTATGLGLVKQQSIKPGSSVMRGTEILLTLSLNH